MVFMAGVFAPTLALSGCSKESESRGAESPSMQLAAGSVESQEAKTAKKEAKEAKAAEETAKKEAKEAKQAEEVAKKEAKEAKKAEERADKEARATREATKKSESAAQDLAKARCAGVDRCEASRRAQSPQSVWPLADDAYCSNVMRQEAQEVVDSCGRKGVNPERAQRCAMKWSTLSVDDCKKVEKPLGTLPECTLDRLCNQ